MKNDLFVDLSRDSLKVGPRVQVTNHALCQVWSLRWTELGKKGDSLWEILRNESWSDVQEVLICFLVDPGCISATDFTHLIICVRLYASVIVSNQLEPCRVL